MSRSIACFNVLAIVVINLAITCVAAAGSYPKMTPSDIAMAITINDWDQPAVFAQTDPITVTVSLNPAEYVGNTADWWVLAETTSGDFFYLADLGWAGPVPLSQVRPVHQGALFPLSGLPVLQVPGLAAGALRFYFGVDQMNGVIDPDIVYTTTDLVVVPPTNSYEADTGTGTLRKAGALWIMNLQGDYYDMGQQYGYLVKDQLLAKYAILDKDIGFTNQSVQATMAQMEVIMDDRERLLLYGMSQETGLTFQQLHFIGINVLFSYFPSCSVFGATRTQTTTGNTIIGRDYDNPTEGMNQFAGASAVIVYNPVGETHGNNHADNQVSVATSLGWFFGATIMNAKGLNFEMLNGMCSVTNLDLTIADALHQNLYAAFDCDTEAQVDARYLNAKVALANLTQVSDATNIWHYERSPLENSMKLLAGQANGGDYYYANLTNEDLFTNYFFLTNHVGQSFRYTSPANDSAARMFQRMVNLQTLAQQHVGSISVAVMKQIMTTSFINNGGTYLDPLTPGTVDQNVFVCITDVKNRIINIFPACERERASWVELDLNQEFR